MLTGRKGIVDVFVDDRRFDDHRPLVNDGRHDRIGSEPKVFGRLVVARPQDRMPALLAHAFLPQGEAHLLGVGGHVIMIELKHQWAFNVDGRDHVSHARVEPRFAKPQ
jgi:hypothetical protein